MRRETFLVLCCVLLAGCSDSERGNLRAALSLELAPSSLDFGVTPSGTAVERTATVRNVGRSPVRVTSVAIVGDGARAFSVEGIVDRPLPPGTSLDMTVAFRPAEAGVHGARLLIRSDANDSPELRAPLTGIAGPPDCKSGFHLCYGECVSNSSVETCGMGCTSCPPVVHGAPTCDGARCGVECKPGHHQCDGACAPDSDVASCGDRCAPCPTVPNGTANCDGAQCGLSCNPGFHLCSGACVSDSSLETCGSQCSPCPTDPNGTATCDGRSCGLTCNSNARLCNGICASCPEAESTTCLGSRCVAECPSGSRPCETGCCPHPWSIEVLSNPFERQPIGSVALAIDSEDGLHLAYCAKESRAEYLHRCRNATFGIGLAAEESEGIAVGVDPTTDVGRVAYVAMNGSVRNLFYGAGQHQHEALFVRELVATGAVTPAMALDMTGVHLLFVDQSAGALVYATRPNGYNQPWTRQRVAISVGEHPGVAVDRSGGVHFAFTSLKSATPALLYRNWTRPGAAFETVATDVQSASVALKLDPAGTPHIAFVALEAGRAVLKYATRTATGWNVEVVDAFTTIGTNISLAIDSSGTAHVSYHDSFNQHLKYAVQIGDGWWVETVDGDQPSGWESAIAVDSQDHPHIIYVSNDGTRNKLVLAH